MHRKRQPVVPQYVKRRRLREQSERALGRAASLELRAVADLIIQRIAAEQALRDETRSLH